MEQVVIAVIPAAAFATPDTGPATNWVHLFPRSAEKSADRQKCGAADGAHTDPRHAITTPFVRQPVAADRLLGMTIERVMHLMECRQV
jgi:hypothetical protein